MISKKRLRDAAASGLLALGVLGLALTTAGARDDETPTIKKIMQVLNKGGKAQSAKLKKELGNASPDWTAIQASAKEFATFGPELVKNEPPKGDAESWKKLAGAYGVESKALDTAAEKKDLTAVKAAFDKLSMACMTCHKAHKP